MKFIVLVRLISTQSALDDVAEVKDAVGFAEKADVSGARFLLHYTSISGVRCCIRRGIVTSEPAFELRSVIEPKRS